MLDNEQITGKALIVQTGDPIALQMTELTSQSQQWIAYAQDRLQAGDMAEVNEALVAVQTISAELARHSDLTARILGGLQQQVDTIAAQRDEAEARVGKLEDEIVYFQEEGYMEMEAGFYEGLDTDSIHAEVEDDRDTAIEWTISELRRLGDVTRADELESGHTAAQQQRQAVEDILSAAEKERYARQKQEWDAQRQRYLAGESDDESDDTDEEDDIDENDIA